MQERLNAAIQLVVRGFGVRGAEIGYDFGEEESTKSLAVCGNEEREKGV
jgi:hypothetical protein